MIPFSFTVDGQFSENLSVKLGVKDDSDAIGITLNRRAMIKLPMGAVASGAPACVPAPE